MMMTSLLSYVCVVCLLTGLAADTSIPLAHIKPCKAGDPKLADCFIQSLHQIKPNLAKGIPEYNVPPTEPFHIDELALSLTSGPQGYKITLKEMDVLGMSNYTVTSLKLQEKGTPYKATLFMPLLKLTADYTSSGVLLILPASGHGTFHCTMHDVTTELVGTVSFRQKKGQEYLRIDTMDLSMSPKTINMHIEKAFLNAPILREASNLFLRENGLEVFDAMKSQMNSKLGPKFKGIANSIVKASPIKQFYTQ